MDAASEGCAVKDMEGEGAVVVAEQARARIYTPAGRSCASLRGRLVGPDPRGAQLTRN